MTHETFESIAALDAIGAASGSEANALRLHLSECIPCRRARDDYGQAALQLITPVEPPSDLRARIAVAVAPVRERSNRVWWLAVAAVLAVALGMRELSIRAAQERTEEQQRQLAFLRVENARLAQQNQKLSAEMASLASAGTRTIALSGQEIAPAASAKVFLEPDRRRAIVFFHDLPANPGDKSYQLWIIKAGDPKPMSAGVFDVTRTGAASISVENLPVATEIKGLAVTLEPRGGVQQPTNTRFYVAGGV